MRIGISVGANSRDYDLHIPVAGRSLFPEFVARHFGRSSRATCKPATGNA
jgi:hypothetical protein